VSFRSAEAHYDWFPFGGSFHVSSGVLAYNGNQVSANATLPGGHTFTLNSMTYSSDPADPVHATGNVTFVKAAPMLTRGWGNLIRRNGRHWSLPFELGAVYEGATRVGLNMTGSVCDSSGTNCSVISSDPTVQNNIQVERGRLAHDVSPLRFYPIISGGFAYRF
jgi:hypothetical protein